MGKVLEKRIVRAVEPIVDSSKLGKVVEPRFVTVNEAPPNKSMELTVKSVVPFARRRAKVPPLFAVAHAGR